MRMNNNLWTFLNAFNLTLFLFICSCGGGGGGGNESQIMKPEITNIQLIKKSSPDNPIDPDPLNTPTKVYVSEELKYRIYYQDPDLDADLLHFIRYYPATKTDPFIDEYIEIKKESNEDGVFEPEEYGFFGAFIGTWRLVFIIEDQKEHQSDPFEIFVEVEQPTTEPPPESPDEQCEGVKPAIQNAYIYREDSPDIPIQNNSGVINVFVNEYLLWQVDYSDENKDAKYIKFNRYYPSHELIPTLSSTYRINQVDIEDSYLHPDSGFFGDFPGEWRLEFQIVDECNHVSDEFSIWVNVFKP